MHQIGPGLLRCKELRLTLSSTSSGPKEVDLICHTHPVLSILVIVAPFSEPAFQISPVPDRNKMPLLTSVKLIRCSLNWQEACGFLSNLTVLAIRHPGRMLLTIEDMTSIIHSSPKLTHLDLQDLIITPLEGSSSLGSMSLRCLQSLNITGIDTDSREQLLRIIHSPRADFCVQGAAPTGYADFGGITEFVRNVELCKYDQEPRSIAVYYNNEFEVSIDVWRSKIGILKLDVISISNDPEDARGFDDLFESFGNACKKVTSLVMEHEHLPAENCVDDFAYMCQIIDGRFPNVQKLRFNWDRLDDFLRQQSKEALPNFRELSVIEIILVVRQQPNIPPPKQFITRLRSWIEARRQAELNANCVLYTPLGNITFLMDFDMDVRLVKATASDPELLELVPTITISRQDDLFAPVSADSEYWVTSVVANE